MGPEKNFSKPWLLKKKVLPQHTDHAGVMWHGSYLSWLEEGRIMALENVGLPYSDLSEEGFEIPVIELRMKYLTSLHHGDEVLMKSWVLKQKGLRLLWKTAFLKKDKKLSAEANIYLALVQRNKRGMRLLRNYPDHISVAIRKLQNGPSL